MVAIASVIPPAPVRMRCVTLARAAAGLYKLCIFVKSADKLINCLDGDRSAIIFDRRCIGRGGSGEVCIELGGNL